MTWPPAGVDWYYADAYTAIACGDCREVMPLLPKVDLVLADPPYGIKRFKKGFGSTALRATDARRAALNGI